MAVILRNSGRKSTGKVEVKDGNLFLPRSIYQRLGSLVKNRNIIDDYTSDSLPIEFRELVDALNDLENVDDATKKLDEYLGSLGVGVEYPYSKDYRGIPPWIVIEEQGEFRNVALKKDGSFEIFDRNIVHTIGSETHNVVHATGE